MLIGAVCGSSCMWRLSVSGDNVDVELSWGDAIPIPRGLSCCGASDRRLRIGPLIAWHQDLSWILVVPVCNSSRVHKRPSIE